MEIQLPATMRDFMKQWSVKVSGIEYLINMPLLFSNKT
jgi:hypothetical protein